MTFQESKYLKERKKKKKEEKLYLDCFHAFVNLEDVPGQKDKWPKHMFRVFGICSKDKYSKFQYNFFFTLVFFFFGLFFVFLFLLLWAQHNKNTFLILDTIHKILKGFF